MTLIPYRLFFVSLLFATIVFLIVNGLQAQTPIAEATDVSVEFKQKLIE